ncbi:MAG: class B sortase [Breznakia sp.]
MAKKKEKKSKPIKKWLGRIVFLVALCVFVYSAFKIFEIKKANYDEKKEVESLREEIEIEKDENLDSFRVDFNKFTQYPDVFAWIVVKDTEISYPVVKGKDNEYYLTHTFSGASNYAGAIFMDYRQKTDFSEYNTFVYGHNVLHGTMFAELQNYMDKTFFEKHPYVYLYTKTGSYKLQVYSAYQDKGDSASYRLHFSSQNDYGSYLSYVKGLSKYDSGVSMDANDHMVTLYTCSYEGSTNSEYVDERYFVHLKMIEALEGEMPYGEAKQ